METGERSKGVDNTYQFLVNEFNIVPVDSYFIDSWIKDNLIFIHDNFNSIMTFKHAEERDNNYIIGIYDFNPDIILSALLFGFFQIKHLLEDDKSFNSNFNIKLFYPSDVHLKLLETSKIFRIMRKVL